MRKAAIVALAICALLRGQTGQEGPRPGWPCVPGRAVDPAYLETSESTGGQLFLFQKSEVAQSGTVMSARYTHPATILRAVGHLSGTREFEFPIESSVESVLVLASLQCRNAIRISRPNGGELTAANSAQSIDLQAGRILRVDLPEAGTWKVRLTGTGLYVLSVLAKSDIKMTNVTLHPREGTSEQVEAHLTGEISDVQIQLIGPGAEPLSRAVSGGEASLGTYRVEVAAPAERFRVQLMGRDSMGRTFQRTYPVLFRPQ